MSINRYFIKLAYDGKQYHGWQVQDNARSVQATITQAIDLILGININLVGCGRTDTGVHAKEFFAHFDLEVEKSRTELEELTFRLNRFLGEDIVIFDIFSVPPDLHARFSAISRTYQYLVHTRKDPFLRDHSWFVHQKTDLGIMNEGASVLLKTDDFTSFSKLHSDTKTNICKVIRAEWAQSGHQMTFTITADRFLRNMVRAIVGTLMDLGQHKISMEDYINIIERKNRSLAGESVPACGLYLCEIKYPF